jgi:hypothetical protein
MNCTYSGNFWRHFLVVVDVEKSIKIKNKLFLILGSVEVETELGMDYEKISYKHSQLNVSYLGQFHWNTNFELPINTQ